VSADKKSSLRVWWIPQVPGEPFLYDVPSLEAGVALYEALAEYDLFQFDHNIKPDYCNAGGMSFLDDDGDWCDFDPDDEFEMAEVAERLAESRVP